MGKVSMPNKGQQMDMLHGPMAKKMILFALPIAATSILQQLFNAVDVAVVGRYVGTGALAAVGTNTPVISLFINCLVSLSVGATVTISHHIGLMEQEGSDQIERIQKIVHTSILFSVLCGIAIMTIGLLSAGLILRTIGAPEEVLSDAILYLRIYLLAAPPIMVYNFLSAILRSIGDTKRPLYILTASGVLNVILNLILVIVFHRGVDGVAIATVISNLFSAAVLWCILMKEQPMLRLYPRRLAIDGRSLEKMLRIGAPASLQGIFFCFSNMCIQSGINSLGAQAMAAAAAGQMLVNFTFYVVVGFNQATLAFAGQNYGAGEKKRCYRVLYLGVVEAFISAAILAGSFLLFRRSLLALFTQDPVVVELTITQMKYTLIPYAAVGVYEIIGAWLRALGHSLEPALVVVVGSVFFRILWLNTAFKWVHTFGTLFIVYPISWAMTITIMVSTAVCLIRRDEKRHVGFGAL